MTEFTRRHLKINGIDTVGSRGRQRVRRSYTCTAPARSRASISRRLWPASSTSSFLIILGSGASAEDPAVTEIHDYVLHYLELFDALELRQFRLVGQSMGGYIATKFAVEHGARVEKLVLVCPIGIPVPPGQPTVNFLEVPPEQLPALLGHSPQTVIKHLPAGAPPPEFIAERVKEATTAGRVLGGGKRTFDEKLPRTCTG
jgi:pimeloyl-ACP methyl ester carboxylesterase